MGSGDIAPLILNLFIGSKQPVLPYIASSHPLDRRLDVPES
jgi:hypothetical protein